GGAPDDGPADERPPAAGEGWRAGSPDRDAFGLAGPRRIRGEGCGCHEGPPADRSGLRAHWPDDGGVCLRRERGFRPGLRGGAGRETGGRFDTIPFVSQRGTTTLGLSFPRERTGSGAPTMPPTRYKWLVVLMLWFVCLFNYADRQAIFSV